MTNNSFTPLDIPGIYAGDVINRKHQLLVKVGSKPHFSNGVYFEGLHMFQIVSQEALTRLFLEKWIPNKKLVGETEIEPAVS